MVIEPPLIFELSITLLDTLQHVPSQQELVQQDFDFEEDCVLMTVCGCVVEVGLRSFMKRS